MFDSKLKNNIIIFSFAALLAVTISIFLFYTFKPRLDLSKAGPSKVIGKAEAAGKRAEPKPNYLSEEQLASQAKQNIGSIHLPILLYHKTPDNFELQMQHLRDTGYTPVTMQEVSGIISKKTKGPAKPIAITFDDGFSDQFKAFEILKKFNFKSTSYIIVGGKESNYCIGSERRPENNCGDSYMSWDEVKRLSDSGLVEIGSHSIDHLQLSALPEIIQKFQIIESKKILEAKIGKSVTSFAYPYGKYNQTSISLVRLAGYTNGVGVEASEDQNINNLFILNRIRDTKDLR